MKESASGRSRLGAMVLLAVLGIGAIAGGVALMLGPQGQIIPLEPELLDGSPFGSYFIPGVILFSVLGLGSLAVAWFAWRRHAWAPMLTAGIGLALLIWLGVQIAIIGYSSDPPLQPIYLVLGVTIGLVGLVWMWREASSRT